MRKSLACLLFPLFAFPALFAQTDNTFYAKQFQGLDVGSKVTAAQNACVSSLNCIIVIDASLNSWAPGTMPARCAKCTWIDYRTPGATITGPFSSSKFGGVFMVDGNDHKTCMAAIKDCLGQFPTPAACTVDCRGSGNLGAAADVIWDGASGVLDPGAIALTLWLGPFYDYTIGNSAVLEDGFNIIGAGGELGRSGTQITSTSTTNAPVFILPVQVGKTTVAAWHVQMRGFGITGAAGNTSQDGMDLDCTQGSATGLAYSLFEDLRFTGFMGDGIHLACSPNGGQSNIQNSQFVGVYSQRPLGGGYALYLGGSVGNLDFLGGQFQSTSQCDTTGPNGGTDVYVGANASASPDLIDQVTVTAGGVVTLVYLAGVVPQAGNSITIAGMESGVGTTYLNGNTFTVTSATISTVTFTAPSAPVTGATTDVGSFTIPATFNAYGVRFIGTTIESGAVLVDLAGANNIAFMGTHHEGCSGTTNGFTIQPGGSGTRWNLIEGAQLQGNIGAGTNGYIFDASNGPATAGLTVENTTYGGGSTVNVAKGGTTGTSQALILRHNFPNTSTSLNAPGPSNLVRLVTAATTTAINSAPLTDITGTTKICTITSLFESGNPFMIRSVLAGVNLGNVASGCTASDLNLGTANTLTLNAGQSAWFVWNDARSTYDLLSWTNN